jgi:hypothetical protein
MNCLQTDGPSHFLRQNAPVASSAGHALLAMSTPPPTNRHLSSSTTNHLQLKSRHDILLSSTSDLLSTYNWVGCLKQEEEIIKKSPNLSAEMTVTTEKLACSMLTYTPEMIWCAVKGWCDNDHVMWHGLQQHQVYELVRKAQRKLGQGDTIKTVENTPQYNSMSDLGRPLLHCSSCFPHPAKPNSNKRIMIFANPANLGLLQGPVDIYTDATFNPCTLVPFYQCLIVMIYDHSTSSFVPVLYALMTHKCKELYSRLFAEIVRLSKYKMRCRTYTSDFERGLMNQMAEHFGNHERESH